MNIAPYKLVLALPRVRTVTLLGFLSRIPATAAGLATTLHVITTLHLGYAEAGLAGSLGMAGIGVGSPLAGRFIDRIGARPVILVTLAAQAVYWAVAPSLPYHWLLVTAFVAGVLTIPVFGLFRQYTAALVPAPQRRTAFAMDSMAVELSYMLGPALAVAGVTALGSVTTMHAVGAGLVAAGIGMILLNAPVQSAEEARQAAVAVPRRRWLNRGMVAILVATAIVTFVLSATELSVVAALNNRGATAWTGLVIALWCVYSLIGGFVYGGLRRTVWPPLLVGGLGALTVPIALVAGGSWWVLLFALIPAGLLCAPSLASTVDSVSSAVPARARGEAMGLHGTALTIGIAAGSPAAGAVIDTLGPAWGFALAGGLGLALVGAAAPFWPRRAPAPAGGGEAGVTAAGGGEAGVTAVRGEGAVGEEAGRRDPAELAQRAA